MKGTVSEYSVLSSDKDEDGQYRVNLEVKIEKYLAPGYDGLRKRIAVMGIDSNPGVCFSKSLSSDLINSTAIHALNSAFTDTRKFSVLDRKEKDVYLLEKELLQSEDVPTIEMSKLGNVKGTDYIFTATIKDLSITDQKFDIKITKENVHNRRANVVIDYKIIIFATRQIKVSSSISVSLTNKEINGSTCESILSKLLDKAAREIVKLCMDNIYPALVLKIERGNIFINLGKGSIEQGAEYTVYEVNEMMMDQYTGEPLGMDEFEIATIKIVDVKPKYSVATILTGDVEKIKPNDIVRKVRK